MTSGLQGMPKSFCSLRAVPIRRCSLPLVSSANVPQQAAAGARRLARDARKSEAYVDLLAFVTQAGYMLSALNPMVDEAEASGQVWRDKVRKRPTAERNRDALARLVEWDADPFETELYERAADPQTILIDRAQRSRAGQYARRLRRRWERKKHS